MELVSGPAKSKYRSRRIHDTQEQNDSEDDHLIFSADNHDELHRAWNHDLKNNKEIAQIGVESIAQLLAATAAIPSNIDGAPTSSPKLVFTDVDSFVSGLQLQNPLDQEQNYSNKPQLFVQELEPTVQDQSSRGMVINGKDEETAPIIREAAIGKGLFGALKLYRRTLGGEGEEDDVVDKKKRKLETTRLKSNKARHDYKEDGIRLEKTDEFGRTLSPKEAYKRFCHTFHGKKSGPRKQENQMKKYQRELKLQEQMNTPSLFVERMKETQARHRTPYIILNDKYI